MLRTGYKQALSRCRQQAREFQFERQALEANLMSREPLVEGCLVVVRKVCGKASCRCKTSKKMRHGPFLHHCLLREGKTRTIHLPKQWEQEVKAGVEAARRFRQARQRWRLLEKQLENLWRQVERHRKHVPYEPKKKGR